MCPSEGTSRLRKLNMWRFFFPIRGKTAKTDLFCKAARFNYSVLAPMATGAPPGLICGEILSMLILVSLRIDSLTLEKSRWGPEAHPCGTLNTSLALSRL